MAVLTVHFNSKTTGLATACRIIIPTNFPKIPNPDFKAEYGNKGLMPVLWMLHGGSDNYTDWNCCASGMTTA